MTLAGCFRCKEGVVLFGDARATIGHRTSDCVQKIFSLNKNLALAIYLIIGGAILGFWQMGNMAINQPIDFLAFVVFIIIINVVALSFYNEIN